MNIEQRFYPHYICALIYKKKRINNKYRAVRILPLPAGSPVGSCDSSGEDRWLAFRDFDFNYD
jgi:hypothetical protein